MLPGQAALPARARPQLQCSRGARRGDAQVSVPEQPQPGVVEFLVLWEGWQGAVSPRPTLPFTTHPFHALSTHHENCAPGEGPSGTGRAQERAHTRAAPTQHVCAPRQCLLPSVHWGERSAGRSWCCSSTQHRLGCKPLSPSSRAGSWICLTLLLVLGQGASAWLQPLQAEAIPAPPLGASGAGRMAGSAPALQARRGQCGEVLLSAQYGVILTSLLTSHV